MPINYNAHKVQIFFYGISLRYGTGIPYKTDWNTCGFAVQKFGAVAVVSQNSPIGQLITSVVLEVEVPKQGANVVELKQAKCPFALHCPQVGGGIQSEVNVALAAPQIAGIFPHTKPAPQVIVGVFVITLSEYHQQKIQCNSLN